MKAQRLSVLIAILAASALVLGACGSSEGSSSGLSSSVDAPKGAPIVVGSIGSFTGPQAATFAEGKSLIQAWADSLNGSGGLNGHPIKLIVKDDGGVPAKALQEVKGLVENEKVVAIVGDLSSADATFQKYLEQKQVPVVGGFPTSQSFSVSPVFFASGSGAAVTALAMFNQAKEAGLKKVGALYCSETPTCAQFVPLGQLSAQLTGLGFASGKISGSAPNYTASCLAMKKEGVDGLFTAHNAAVLPRVASGCIKAGFNPTNIGSMSSLSPQLLTDPAFKDSLWTAPNANYLDTSIPGVKAMTDALKKYAPKVLESEQYTQLASYSWIGGKLFEAASQAAGGFSPTTTPAEVMDGLYKLKGETLDGMAPPLTFQKGKPSFSPCYFTAQIDGKTLVSTEGGKPTCLPDAQVTALISALSAAS